MVLCGCNLGAHWRHVVLSSQLAGTKRVMLFGPEQATALNPPIGPDGSRNGRFSLDEDGTIFSSQPFPATAGTAASGAVGIELELGPGDALYIPNGWWHALEATSHSVRPAP